MRTLQLSELKNFPFLKPSKTPFYREPGTKHATLVDQFAYPEGGTGSVYEAMRLFIESKGGRVMTGTGVEKIMTSNGTVTSVQLERREGA